MELFFWLRQVSCIRGSFTSSAAKLCILFNSSRPPIHCPFWTLKSIAFLDLFVLYCCIANHGRIKWIEGTRAIQYWWWCSLNIYQVQVPDQGFYLSFTCQCCMDITQAHNKVCTENPNLGNPLGKNVLCWTASSFCDCPEANFGTVLCSNSSLDLK